MKEPPDEEPPEEGKAEGVALAATEELADAEGPGPWIDAGPPGFPDAEGPAETGAEAPEPVAPVGWLFDGAGPTTGAEVLVEACGRDIYCFC